MVKKLGLAMAAVAGVLLMGGILFAGVKTEPKLLKADCIRGTITAVNESGDSMTVTTTDGKSRTFKLNASTQYNNLRIDKDSKPYQGRMSSIETLRQSLKDHKSGVDCAIAVSKDGNTAEIVCFGTPKASRITR